MSQLAQPEGITKNQAPIRVIEHQDWSGVPLGATQVREARRLVAFVFVIRARSPPLKRHALTVLFANIGLATTVLLNPNHWKCLSNSSKLVQFSDSRPLYLKRLLKMQMSPQ